MTPTPTIRQPCPPSTADSTNCREAFYNLLLLTRQEEKRLLERLEKIVFHMRHPFP
ncbi:hypothetical protein D3C85_700860 [compost metagenome]